VYALDGNALVNRSGPRLVESLELFAHLLHPDRFAASELGTYWRAIRA
jgi:iron complex transport system substrate-binding protein